jgi:hypothetical protein
MLEMHSPLGLFQMKTVEKPWMCVFSCCAFEDLFSRQRTEIRFWLVRCIYYFRFGDISSAQARSLFHLT